jgi:hypothetical protein
MISCTIAKPRSRAEGSHMPSAAHKGKSNGMRLSLKRSQSRLSKAYCPW